MRKRSPVPVIPAAPRVALPPVPTPAVSENADQVDGRFEDDCECGRERRFCRTFNDEEAPHGDDA